MIELDTDPVSLKYPSDSYQNLESARRLIVLIPADVNSNALTHRVWKLANTLNCQILFLSLCADEAQESSLRRQLITMSAIVQDGKVCAESRLEFGANWVNAIKSDLQGGDMIVCFAGQRTGLLQRPLSQILQTNLRVPIYILSGLSDQNVLQRHPLSQVLGWLGSIVIIVGALLLQIRIVTLSENWAQTTLLILSMMGEIGLLWGWNALFD